MLYPEDSQGELNHFLDSLAQEASEARKEVVASWEANLAYARGKQWPERIPDHRVDFVMNLIGSSIKRKAGLLTDTKPIISVVPRSDPSLAKAAEVLTEVVRGVWDERGVLDAITWALYIGQIFGCCPINTVYDKSLDFGVGDVDVKPWDPRHFLVDPGLVRASRLQEAEYIVLEDLRPLDLIRYEFGEAAKGISADPKYSYYSTYARESSPQSAISTIASPQPLKSPSEDTRKSVIPRVVVQEFWIKDRRRMADLPPKVAKRIRDYLARMRELHPHEAMRYRDKGPEDMVFNGGIRHIIRAGGKILLDEGNPYWDMLFPVDIIAWGMEVEHPWGASEVAELRKIQAVINKLGGVITENAIKVSNGIWVGDFDALSEKEWRMLDDRPNAKIMKRPGREIRREPAPPIPGSTFATLTFLVQAVEQLTGLGETSPRPRSGVSGVAVEALLLAAQTLIRLQAREIEGVMQRIGQKLISRIAQFYSSKRLFNIFGPDGRLAQFEYSRDVLLGALKDKRLEDVWRDFRFVVQPGSSLAITKVQEALLNANLYNMGLIPGKEVLKAFNKSDPEGLIREAKEERLLGMAPPAVPIRQGTKSRTPVSFPATGPL